MKLSAVLANFIVLANSALAGESALTTTFQPLDGLGSGRIQIVQVTCHHWHANSASSAVDLIDIPNVPPTDNPEQAKENLNLASVCGVKLSTSDLGAVGAPLEVTMDLTKFSIPKRYGYPREDIVRACLECLRRTLPRKLHGTPLTLKASDADLSWVAPIVAEFNKHDRAKEFYSPAE